MKKVLGFSILLLAGAVWAQTYIKGPALYETPQIVVAAGVTTQIGATSNTNIMVTGTTTQILKLAAGSQFGSVGRRFRLSNRSTGVVTVLKPDNSTLTTVPAGYQHTIILTDTTTDAWDVDSIDWVSIYGGTMTGSLGLNYGTVTPDRVCYVDGSRIVRTSADVDSTELSYLDGVTANIQTQLNGKEPTQTKGTISSTTSQLTVTNGASSTVGPNVSIAVSTANLSTTGLLASSDFATFNGVTGKVDRNGDTMGGSLSVGVNDVKALTVTLDGLTSATKAIRWSTAGLLRWIARTSANDETGSNAGSDWQLLARDDAGNAIDTAVSITRAAGGNFTTNRPVQFGGLTPSTVPVLNGTTVLTSSAVTATELGYLSGATANIQTQINSISGGSGLPTSGGTMTGDIQFAGNRALKASTSDGSDNQSFNLNGGGAASINRGGGVTLYGNEASPAGDIDLFAGNVSGGSLNFYTGAFSLRGQLSDAGAWTLGASGGTEIHTFHGSIRSGAGGASTTLPASQASSAGQVLTGSTAGVLSYANTVLPELQSRIIRGRVTPGAGSCTLNAGSGFSVTDNSTGLCNVNFSTSFSATPQCSGWNASNNARSNGDGSSVSSVTMAVRDAAGALTDGVPVDFICIGDK